MKKLFTFILCAVFTIAARAQFSGSGNGTEADPYRIYTDIHLAQMANFLNQEGVVFELMKDVDLSSYISENSPSQGWVPIGVESTPFKGVLKGNNHTISGLYINRASTNNVGLFGYVTGATIENLTVNASSIAGSTNVGALIGYVSGTTFTNCTVNVSSANGVKASDYIGGMVGRSLSCTFSNCEYTGNINATGSTGYAGGFIGHANSGSLTDCNITSTVNAKAYCGGAVGSAEGVNLTNVTMRGNVNGTTSVGGIVGYATNAATWTNVNYYGNIAGSANVAGVVGELSGASVNLVSAYSKGKITNTGDYTGGIVAKSNGGCIAGMENSSHFGDIEGKDYVGGIAGAILNIVAAPTLHTYYVSSSNSTNNKIYGPYYDTVVNGSSKTNSINNCTAIGNISGSEYVGGMIGKDEVATGYTSSTSRPFTNNSNTFYYLWIDDEYSGNGSWYLGIDVTQYTKNIVSIHLTNSFFSGNINGKSNVGGLIGHKEGGSITNCYTYATIAGESNIGGIAGTATGSVVSSSSFSLTLKSNVAINSSITATSSNVGRIFGNRGEAVTIGALASAEGNRALTQTKVMLCGVAQDVIDDEQNGTSVGPSMLRLKANYVSWGWNFDDNWNILETECYPYKKYQAAPPVIESSLKSQDTNISGKSVNGGTVYMYYKDRDAVSTDCDGYNWAFTTEALQSGAQVQLYADVDGMTPSYLTSATVKFPGSGTEDDPYRIYTAEDLQGATNSGCYKLMNDIDLTSWINENSPVTGWPAIGRNSTVATYINGDGHKVTGLWINTDKPFNGLFSNYSAGYIKNLTVEVAKGKKVQGGDNTGILIGRMANGSIINCSVNGEVESSDHTGGVAGITTSSTLKNVNFSGSVAGHGYFIGGLTSVADYESTVDNCQVTNASISNDSNTEQVYAGGLVGFIGNGTDGTIQKSMADVTLTYTGSALAKVGGLVGEVHNATIAQCYSSGTVSAAGTESLTGGLVGEVRVRGSVSDSYSTADVNGTYFTGGLAGYCYGTIDNCYAKGDVRGVQFGAGLVGELDGTTAKVNHSVAANNIVNLTSQSSWGCRVIGGFKNGCIEPTFGSNLALSTMQVSLNGVAQRKTDDNIEGVAKTETELKTAATYLDLNWNLSDVWSIDEGQIYPYLLWEIDTNPVVDLTLDKSSLILAVGNEATLTAAIQPLGATNKRLTWKSSKPAVAIVEDGVVTAVSVGEAVITATTTDGSNLSATCMITVVANHDAAIQELQTLVDEAQDLYDNSTEGDNIGQYAPGSRAALLLVIKSVKSRISSTMSESEIADCTTQLNNAITDFKAKRVTGGTDTDLTAYDDVVYLEGFESAPDQQHTLSVQLNNVKSLTGFQCDIYLPEGVSVVYDEYGYANATLNEARANSKVMSFDAEPQSDGSLRLLAYSSKNIAFTGNEGEVAQVNVMLSETMEDGEHPLILKNIVLTEASGKTIEIDYVKTTLTITSYMLGDANGDLKINVGDLAATASHILGNTPDSFVEKAADANEDGKINVGDLAKIAGIILGTASQAPMHVAAADDAEDDFAGIFDASMSIEPLSYHEYMLHIGVENIGFSFSGFQFDLQLPAGLNVMTDEYGYVDAVLNSERTNARNTDIFDAAFLQDGSLRVLCASTHNMMFADEQGEVLAIRLLADEAFDGNGLLALTNICYTATGEGLEAADVMMDFADAITSIQNVMSHDEFFVWDLNGRMVVTTNDIDALPMGIYMINGKKIVK